MEEETSRPRLLGADLLRRENGEAGEGARRRHWPETRMALVLLVRTGSRIGHRRLRDFLCGGKAMNDRRSRFGLALGLSLAAAMAVGLIATTAVAQRHRTEPRYEYKVVNFSYNPGERLTDEARAAAFGRLLNDHARDGWEPVINLLDRTTMHTVGGGVTTRHTTAFVAFRRPR